MKIVDQDRLRLADHIKAGACVSWGQGSGEATTLVEKLVVERSEIGPLRAFTGLSLSDALLPEHTDFIKAFSFGALGNNSRLQKAGVLTLYPCNYSAVSANIREGRFPIDTVFVQISAAGPDGSHSLGYCNDFLPVAMQRAKLVIGEINSNVPWTYADVPLDEKLFDFAIETDRMPPELAPTYASDEETVIGANVAALVKDGATLEYGIGSLPGAILKALGGHQNLGLHTGLITEDIIDLVEAGIINNSRKAVFAGLNIGAFCIGGKRLRDFLHCNEAFQLQPSWATHSPKILSQLDNLVAINSALEVDLYGQVNTEQIGERYIGAIGGQVDFMHAASTNPNGLAIIAISATTGEGMSRIVPKLNGPYVTTSRGDIDAVVTEFGVADLRGRSLRDRGLLLCEIAAPQFREQMRYEFLKQH